jgi:hypothetical protein
MEKERGPHRVRSGTLREDGTFVARVFERIFHMELSFLVPLLALITLLAVAVFALMSKSRVEKRRRDPDAPKSTLAEDSPDR